MTGMNPLDWYGAEFLIFYGFGLLVSWLLGHAIVWWIRPQGSAGYVDNPNDLALLSGQKDRLGEAAVARMLDRGLLSLEGRKRLVRNGGAPSDPVEAEIMALGARTSWNKVSRAVRGQADHLRERLVMRGLMTEKVDAWTTGLAAAVPMFALFALGVAKYFTGVSRDRPVGLLIIALILTVVFLLMRVFGTDRRTKAGIAAYKEAASRNARLRIAPRGPETGMAVALFGTGVIATGPLGDFHRMRSAGSGDGSGGDSSGDGGCGGGCGGCGG